MSDFTPGPWGSIRSGQNGGCYIRPAKAASRPMGLAIAQVFRSGDEKAANARLLSSAPDLLEALKDILEQAEASRMPMGPDLSDSIFVLGKAAIAKAEGK